MLFKALGAAALAASSLLLPTTSLSTPPRGIGVDSAAQIIRGIFGGRTTATTRRSARGSSKIPPGQRPPAGMCRVWINGVPPGHQPRATDCATAEIRAAQTANARVIYGDQQAFPGRGRGSVQRGRVQRGGDDNEDRGSVQRGGDDNEDRGVGEQDGDEDDNGSSRGVLGSIGARTDASARAQARDARGRPWWAGGKGRGHGRGHGGD